MERAPRTTGATEQGDTGGFTLVEVLVAVAMTSLVLLAVYGVFAAVSGTRQRLEEDGAAYHRARVLFDRIGRELRGAYLKPTGTDTLLKGGLNSEGHPYLSLTTTAVTPQSPAQGIALVSYELLDDPESATGQKVLMRRETSPLHGNDQQPAYRLAPGIKEMSIRFYNGSEWQQEWDSSGAGRPQLVEIALRIHTDGAIVPFRSAFDVPVLLGR